MIDLPGNVTIVIIGALVCLTMFGMFLTYMYYQSIRNDK